MIHVRFFSIEEVDLLTFLKEIFANMFSLNPKHHLQAVSEIILLLTRHRELTFEMAKREITDRYLGQVCHALVKVW